jgi:lipoprotein signal peptidase
MKGGGRTLLGLFVALAVLALDQASKWWIVDVLRLTLAQPLEVLPWLSLTLVHNRGITFGLLDSGSTLSTIILAAVALAIVAGLLLWLRRAEHAWVAGAIGAVAGGAVGNVIDRLRLGYVVEFIHAHYAGWSWYVFNLADAAIVCGVGVLVLDGLRRRPASAEPLARADDGK